MNTNIKIGAVVFAGLALAVHVVFLLNSSHRTPNVTSAPSTSSSAMSVAVTTVPDRPGTRKKGETVYVTYLKGSRVGNTAVLAFQVENTTDTEQPISSFGSFQATDEAGAQGAQRDSSKCDGMAPPHGKFACVLGYDFPSPPKQIRVRADGAWFRLELEAPQ